MAIKLVGKNWGLKKPSEAALHQRDTGITTDSNKIVIRFKDDVDLLLASADIGRFWLLALSISRVSIRISSEWVGEREWADDVSLLHKFSARSILDSAEKVDDFSVGRW